MSDSENEIKKPTRSRDPAFNDAEDEALIRGYHARKNVIEGKQKEAGSNKKKKAAWNEIAAEVNAKDIRCNRDAEKVKSRYRNMFNDYKAYKNELKAPKTGNKAAPKTQKYYDIFDELMSEDVRVVGIGGAETGLTLTQNESVLTPSFGSINTEVLNNYDSQDEDILRENFGQSTSSSSVTQPLLTIPQTPKAAPTPRTTKKRKANLLPNDESNDLRLQIQQKQLRILEIQEKNVLAQNARYVLDYKQKAEEMNVPSEEIQSKISEFDLYNNIMM